MDDKSTKLNEILSEGSSFDTEMISNIIIVCSIVILILLFGTLIVTLFIRAGRRRQNRKLRAMESGRLSSEQEETLSGYLMSPLEKPHLYLGQDLVEDYVSDVQNTEAWENGQPGDGMDEYGFAFLTGRRLYIKGRHYYRGKKGKIKCTSQPETYDRSEILGFREQVRRPIWPVVFAVSLALVEIGGLGVLLVIRLTGSL